MENYTKSSQFDKSKIKTLLHLESLGNFNLLPEEVAYLNRYRQVLTEEVLERRKEEAEFIKTSVQQSAIFLNSQKENKEAVKEEVDMSKFNLATTKKKSSKRK